MTPEKNIKIENNVNKINSKIAKNVFRVGLATSMLLGAPGCVATQNILTTPTPEISPLPADSTKAPTLSPTEAPIELTPVITNPATQELTLVPPTEVATEIPVVTLAPEPTATVEAAPVNMDEVIDLTKLSPEQIAVVNEEMIKRIEQFKKGEICGDEVMKEYGLYSNPNLVDIEPHLGILSVSQFAIAFQGCVLGGFLQNVKENDGKEYLNMYLMVGYEKKLDRERSVSIVRNELGKLTDAKYIYRVEYVHGKNTISSLSTTYSFPTKDDVLVFWKTSVNKPITFQFGLYERGPFSPQDIEYLKSIGTDPVLLEKNLQNYNLSLNLSKGLALSGHCNKDEFDPNYGYICDLNNENPPVEINSLTDALVLMDGRLLPNTNVWRLRGAGPQY